MTDQPDEKDGNAPGDNTDGIWRRTEIESPCQKICVMHPGSGLCVGCFRTRDEIAGWSRMTPDDRRAVMTDLPGRESLIAKRSGGRRGRKNLR